MFSCKFVEMFKNHLFYRTPLGDLFKKKHSNTLKPKTFYGLKIAQSIIYVKEYFLCFFYPERVITQSK